MSNERTRPPVLLIHGMWGTGSTWDVTESILSELGYDVHAPTLPGHDEGHDQPARVATISVRDYVDFLERRANELPEKPIVIGHSMGGLLAQSLAARIQPRALVLLTPAAPAGINSLRPSTVIAFAPALARWGFWRKPHRLGRKLGLRYAVNRLTAHQQNRHLDSLVFESGRAVGEIGMWWADRRRAAAVETSRITCPVYVVGCTHDGLTPLSLVVRVAGLYPQSHLRVYPNRGHWVIDDELTFPMITEIATWLDVVASSSSP